MGKRAVNSDVEQLVVTARCLGATFRLDASRVKVSAPEPLPDELVAKLKAKKAAIGSYLALPEEHRPVARWAAWVAEHVPAEEVTIEYYESPLKLITLKLSESSRYVSGVLGRLSLLQTWEAAGASDLRPGWRAERIDELCGSLLALREALRPLGLAEIGANQE